MAVDKRKGAAAELLVCCDLLRAGWDVFRSVNQHCTCDLVVAKDGYLARIEVRSVTRRLDGSISPNVAARDECDLYAFVAPDEEIIYMTTDEAWSAKVKVWDNSPVRPQKDSLIDSPPLGRPRMTDMGLRLP